MINLLEKNKKSNQMLLGMDLSPAEWMAQMRVTIKKARKAGANTKILEYQQSKAFTFFKKLHKSGRV